MRLSTPRWVSRATVAIGVLLATSATAYPASAQDDVAAPNRLELSVDGTTFSPELSRPLFENTPRLVPGESVADSLWARNSSAEPAVVSLYAVGAVSTLPADIPAADGFQVLASSPDGLVSTTALTDLAPCAALAQAVLSPGQAAELRVQVALPETSGNVSQEQSVSMSFVVDLRAVDGGGARCGADPDPSSGPDPAPSPGPAGENPPIAAPGDPALGQPNSPLPRTGSEVLPVLIIALLCVSVGTWMRRAA